MARIGFMASEKMSFENVDDGQMMTDGRGGHAYTISSPMSFGSGELIMRINTFCRLPVFRNKSIN